MSTYLDTMKAESEAKIKPLAERATLLATQLDSLRHRHDREKENLKWNTDALAELKAGAGAALTGDANGFEKFRRDMMKREASIRAGEEIIASFDREIIPTAVRVLAGARQALEKGLEALVLTAKPACEAKMGEHIKAAVGEGESFLVACRQLYATWGVPWTGDEHRGCHLRPDGAFVEPGGPGRERVTELAWRWRDRPVAAAPAVAQASSLPADVAPAQPGAAVEGNGEPESANVAPDTASDGQPGDGPAQSSDAPDAGTEEEGDDADGGNIDVSLDRRLNDEMDREGIPPDAPDVAAAQGQIRDVSRI